MQDDLWLKLAENVSQPQPKKKRKKHRLACGRCGKPMHLHGQVYVCPDYPRCRGSHKAHKDGTPTGIPADAPTGEARRIAHQRFDQIWKSGKVTRPQAYLILKRVMGLSIPEAHISRFSKDQCLQLVKRLDELGDAVYAPLYNSPGLT